MSNPKMREFENDTFLHEEMKRLVARNKIKAVIETGTEYGGTANAFSMMPPVEMVLTIDIEQKVALGDLLPDVHFLHCDSRPGLTQALTKVCGAGITSVLFFLDAHTSVATDVCPLNGELAIIRDLLGWKPAMKRPVIVIHDCVVPGKDFGFDTYKDGPISWESVQSLIGEIYPAGYAKHFNTEATGSVRGCLFIEPVSREVPKGAKV